VGLASVDGTLLAQEREPCPAASFAEQFDLVSVLLERLGEELGRPAAAMAVGIAGITRHGHLVSAVNLGLSAPCDLAGRLRATFGVPVLVVNDVQAAAAAEAAQGAPGTLALLTVGTGVGGAVVSGGQLVVGDGAAGDFGHIVMIAGGPECACGRRGCLEQLVSGRVLDAVARDLATSGSSPWLAARAAQRPLVHAGDLDAAARAGDPAALGALEEAASTLSAAVRTITAAFDPSIVVLGGGLMTGDRLLPALLQRRWPDERPPWSGAEIRVSELGTDAGLLGAAFLAGQVASVGPQGIAT
jgi:glucokinase